MNSTVSVDAFNEITLLFLCLASVSLNKREAAVTEPSGSKDRVFDLSTFEAVAVSEHMWM